MSTARSTWKAAERRVAAYFGSTRTPLSGGNSKHTRSDTLSPDVFVETKYRAHSATASLFDKTAELARKEGKLPVVVLVTKRRKGFLVVTDDDTFVKLARKIGFRVRLRRKPDGPPPVREA